MSYASADSEFTPSVRELALEVAALLRELDPAGWRDSIVASARLRLERVMALMEQALALAETSGAALALRERLTELARSIEAYAPTLGLAGEGRDAWMRLRGQLLPRYDALARSLRELEVHVPSLRPTNYKRNVFHMASALLSLSLIFSLSQAALLWAAAGFAAWAWSAELSRRRWPAVNRALMKMLGPVAHPHEHWRVNSATWYATAVVILAATGDPRVQVSGVVILGVADPLAAIVGRRYGRHKLIHGRSLEGSSAFLVSGSAAALASLALLVGVPIGTAAAVAIGAALPATIAELLSRRVDDNLSIPLCAAAGAWLTLQLLGG